jgi:hypothetical protein
MGSAIFVPYVIKMLLQKRKKERKKERKKH